MQKNELMIGNLVNYQNITYSVYEITKECAILQDVSANKVVLFDELSPVPLTEHWFLEFGFAFKKTEKSNSYSKDSFRANFITDGRFKGKMYLIYANCFQWEKCEVNMYVHKLQNLYFALTNEDILDGKEIHTKSTASINS
jgi:hypothetical protein